ncbi:MAG: 2-amino-4-hydroxy-6-hydroxymethyldihydropteridine diphosphokinase [Gammaproteobacteria bacterium]|nr:2-amino-4-hydroxy-6-hydroxymethyldihydropteridine diphosphokinase [Gammaproteobacteria bacterium]
MAVSSGDWSKVFLGLGSNLQSPRDQILRAFRALQQLPESRDAVCSPFYASLPMGPADQPNYINAAVRLLTRLPAERLLGEIQSIENAQGRVRGRRWGARTLDIDLLLYGQEIIDRPELQVPHPGIPNRLFVLRPLLDLEPLLSIPQFGLASLLAERLEAAGADPPVAVP